MSRLQIVNDPDEWVRPSDWLSMPATAANTIHILAAVFDHPENYCAIKCTTSTGTYTVNWGDGTSDTTVASGSQIDHLYSYSDADLNGTVSSLGYKQAMITITPNTGNLTGFTAAKNATGGSANPWLDMTIQCASLTTLLTYLSNCPAIYLQRCNIIAIGAITTLANLFSGCRSLQVVNFPDSSLASVTSLSSSFTSCSLLKNISFPENSLSSVTTLSSTFNGCYTLKSVTFPSGSLSLVDSLANAFVNCYSITSLSFPSGSLSAVTTAQNAFSGCSELKSITFPSGSLGSVLTTISGMFNNCYQLEAVTFPSGSLSAVTTISTAFANCYLLRIIIFPTGAFASLTTTTGAFPANCYFLSSIVNCTIPVTFTLASCQLSSPALNAIYTSLPTVTGQTITVTGNPGVVNDTPSIATAKGWTVTG